MRAPGFVGPPFDRPAPKRFAWDDPEHTPEIKANVASLAKIMRDHDAVQRNLPCPDPSEPIPDFLWRRLSSSGDTAMNLSRGRVGSEPASIVDQGQSRGRSGCP
jgi:hypothetical protein